MPETPSRCRLAAASRRRLHRHRLVAATGRSRGRHASTPLRLGVRRIEVDTQMAPLGCKPARY